MVVSGCMIATALVVVIAAGLALVSFFDDKAPPPPPHSYRKHQRRRSRRRSSSSDHSSDSKGFLSSGFELDENLSRSSFSKANSVYSDSPKVKSDSGLGSPGSVNSKSRSGSPVPNSKSRSSDLGASRLDGSGSRRPGSVDSNSTKSSSRSGSSSSNSKSRTSGSSASRLDENGPVVSRRPGSVDLNSTKSISRSGSSSSKSKSRPGSVASSSSISKCESWSITSDENSFPLCLRSDSCITCGDKESGVVTFFPCGGSYLCKKCAFKFLDIGNYCCKCGLEIENVSLKK